MSCCLTRKQPCQKTPGMRIRSIGHLLGCSCCNDLSPSVATFRAQVDNPVGCLDNIEVVFDHYNRVAMIT